MFPGRIGSKGIGRSFTDGDTSWTTSVGKLSEAVGVSESGGNDVIKTEVIQDTHRFELRGSMEILL